MQAAGLGDVRFSPSFGWLALVKGHHEGSSNYSFQNFCIKCFFKRQKKTHAECYKNPYRSAPVPIDTVLFPRSETYTEVSFDAFSSERPSTL